MTSRTALFALLAMWGVGFGGATLPARADDAPTDSAAEAKAESSLPAAEFTNRVWVRSDAGDLSAIIRVFLRDGTLVQDSSWGNHSLSTWKPISETKLSWNEDGKDVTAQIAWLSADRMTLVLDGKGGPVVENYEAVPLPAYPDIPHA